ncbi:hypothetical protein DLD82_04315 [Methanospirillum stamsii]|uniref:Uncharacterized protein n=1 Tax=Methanospirillum stamsii TaxID=1277351 RepID=A0A2V2NCN0_9EURY|nr:hypothetical protein DLD82_04315 [Methanospirillum stamsii]
MTQTTGTTPFFVNHPDTYISIQSEIKQPQNNTILFEYYQPGNCNQEHRYSQPGLMYYPPIRENRIGTAARIHLAARSVNETKQKARADIRSQPLPAGLPAGERASVDLPDGLPSCRPGESTYARTIGPGICSTTGGFNRMIILPERTDTGKCLTPDGRGAGK